VTLFHTATCYTAKNIGYIGVFRHTDFTDNTDLQKQKGGKTLELKKERVYKNTGIKERKSRQKGGKIQKQQK
jgi:hypothetical protein